jgi:vacuolar protein sorting-associated protein 29
MSSGGSFTDFGELVLLVGDFHIPYKKPSIPPVFRELLNTDKIKTVLCTGNVGCDSVVEELRQISQNVHIVRGDMDSNVSSLDLPDTAVVKIGQFKVGLIHGHQVLPWGNHQAMAEVLRKLDADILVSGHTHKNEIFQSCGKFFVNPGSVTGASSEQVSPGTSVTPSFMLMAVQGPSAIVYVYELVDGKASVALSEFTKAASA